MKYLLLSRTKRKFTRGIGAKWRSLGRTVPIYQINSHTGSIRLPVSSRLNWKHFSIISEEDLVALKLIAELDEDASTGWSTTLSWIVLEYVDEFGAIIQQYEKSTATTIDANHIRELADKIKIHAYEQDLNTRKLRSLSANLYHSFGEPRRKCNSDIKDLVSLISTINLVLYSIG